jgi:hypothetical protein
MPRHHGEKGAWKRRRDEQWEAQTWSWNASSWASPAWAAGAWLPDAEPAGPDVADGVSEPATGGGEKLALTEGAQPLKDLPFTDDEADRLWGDARVVLTGLLGRRVARLEAMLRERPECQVLAFEVSQEMVETLVPRLLDLLAEQNGGRRGHDGVRRRALALFSNILTPDGAMLPYVTEERWRDAFRDAAERLAGKRPPVPKANLVQEGKVTSFVKSTKEGHKEWGMSGVHYRDSDGDLRSAAWFIDSEGQVLPIGTDIYFVLSVSEKGNFSARQVCVRPPSVPV